MTFNLQVEQAESLAILDALDRFCFDPETHPDDKNHCLRVKEKLLGQIQQQFEERR